MATLILATLLFLIATAGMAVGLFFGRRPPQGSCGGLGCDACGRRCTRRKDPAP